MRNIKKRSGFSLIELMVVVVNIGILAAVALPSYKKYISKAKMVEAYTILGAMTKNQITYFNENNEFYNTGNNQKNPNAIIKPMVVWADPVWEKIGYPAPVGSKVNFTFGCFAGKTDNSGSDVATPGKNGIDWFLSWASYLFETLQSEGPTSIICDQTLANARTLGLPTAPPNHDWAVLAAVSDLDNDYTTECTAVGRLLESSAATGRRPVARGFIILNYGK